MGLFSFYLPAVPDICMYFAAPLKKKNGLEVQIMAFSRGDSLTFSEERELFDLVFLHKIVRKRLLHFLGQNKINQFSGF